MIDLNLIEQNIIEKYPNTLKVKGKQYNLKIPLKNNIFLEFNYKKYPKMPRAKLIRNDGKAFKVENIISTLRNWDKTHPSSLIELIQEIELVLNTIISNKILIRRDLMVGLMEMCVARHPENVKGVLGVEKGIVTDYILPSRACTDPSKEKAVWGISSCAIPLNFSY